MYCYVRELYYFMYLHFHYTHVYVVQLFLYSYTLELLYLWYSCIMNSCLLHATHINSPVILASGTKLSATPHMWCRAPLDSNTLGVKMTRMYPMIVLASGRC